MTLIEAEECLRSLGFEPTETVLEVGTYWKKQATNQILLLPVADDGEIPDWIITDLVDMTGAN